MHAQETRECCWLLFVGGEFLFLSSFVEYISVMVHTSSVALLGVLQTLFLTCTILCEEDCVFFLVVDVFEAVKVQYVPLD